MSTLKRRASPAVQSMEELFAIAYSMEQEAANRYSQIAAILRIQDNPALAEEFRALSCPGTAASRGSHPLVRAAERNAA